MTNPNSTNALVEFAAALVQTPSVLGNEAEMARAVSARMERLGYDEVAIDSTGNTVGVIQGAQEGPTILFDAHMDTVDVIPRESWSRDPFSGAIEDGKLYGRGSSDMKGALAAMVYAAARLDRSRLAGRVVVSASVNEETIEGPALKRVMDRHRPDYVVIGESSDLNLVRAGRGRAEFVVSAKGKPAHAAAPERGENAILKMTRVIAEVEALPMPSDDVVGSGVMVLTDIVSTPYPGHSVIPSRCRATYERRLVPADTLESTLKDFQEAFARADAAETEIELAVAEVTTYTGETLRQKKWFPAWVMAVDDEFVQASLRALEGIGLSPALTSYQFCTNAAYSAGVAGVPTVGFGPSREHMAHIVDESAPIEHLSKVAEGYTAISQAILSS